MKINVNDYVRVKLTQKGIKTLKEHCGPIEFIPLRQWRPFISDNEGYIQFRLFEIMGIFGHEMYDGNPSPPFFTEIIIDEKNEQHIKHTDKKGGQGMKYTIEELRHAFYNQEKVLHAKGCYDYITGYSISFDRHGGQATHQFEFSHGYAPKRIISTKEERQMEPMFNEFGERTECVMKPAEIIKQEKQVLEQAIREACKKFLEQGIKDACKEFVTATGVAVPSIEVDFDSRETLSSSPYEMHICRVSVDYADI